MSAPRPPLIDRLIPDAIRARGPDDARLAGVVVASALVGAPLAALLSVRQFLVVGSPESGVAVGAAALGAVLTPAVLRASGSARWAMHYLAAVGFGTTLAASWFRGGFVPAILVWDVAIAVIITLARAPRALVVWSALIMAKALALWAVDSLGLAPPDVPSTGIAGFLVLVLMLGAVGLEHDRRATRLERDREELERRVRAQERLELLGQLAGGAAHDFNNLLTVGRMHAQALLDELGPTDRARADLLAIVGAAERGSQLTRRLLALGRSDPGIGSAVVVADLLEDARGLLRRVLPGNVELVVRPPPEGASVLAEPGQLEQVLTNLILNARDALPSGGRVELAAAVVGGPAPGDARVVVSVEDNGPGVPAELRARVFSPFFTTKAESGGTGLGLASSRAIAERWGGTLELAGASGSRFELALPLLPGASAPRAAAPASQRPSARPRDRVLATVLVVEDEPAVLRGLLRVLGPLGHRVLTAPDGAAAATVAASTATPVDVLVTDVALPALPGPAIAEAIRRRSPGVRVIYTSGSDPDEAVAAEVRAGRARFLRKPYDGPALAAELDRVLCDPQPAE
ncbi:MAG: response regulator [Deltaproteobacteria bacterium]|nr:response regulator [Deltaproteobacteria bacterium]